MTYQAPVQEFNAARGENITSAPLALVRRALHAVGGMFKRIGTAYCKAALASSRMQMVQKLNEKSDAELAELNIKRDDIVQYAFRDLRHI